MIIKYTKWLQDIGTKWPQGIPNDHKIYQMTTKYTKWPQNIPNGRKYSKWPQNIPNYHKICRYTKWPQNIPNDNKICQMALYICTYVYFKGPNSIIFHSKTLPILPKLEFLVWKYVYHLATLMLRSFVKIRCIRDENFRSIEIPRNPGLSSKALNKQNFHFLEQISSKNFFRFFRVLQTSKVHARVCKKSDSLWTSSTLGVNQL
jgi:hypothetical protein